MEEKEVLKAVKTGQLVKKKVPTLWKDSVKISASPEENSFLVHRTVSARHLNQLASSCYENHYQNCLTEKFALLLLTLHEGLWSQSDQIKKILIL